jgi:ABC-type amino acid transport substrate-binding protein/nitrogen-specific signal transduction histidine kinase
MNFFFRLLLFIIFFINQSFSNDNTIKIAISNNMIPYSFVDENNKLKGILVDYWKLWSYKTNQKIEFVPLTWSGTLESIKNNKVDIHSGLFINQSRSKYINFLKPIYKTTSKIYIKNENIKKIKTITDLNNKNLGLISDSFFDSYMKNYHPKIKIKRYETYDTMLSALLNDEIDAVVDDSVIMWFQLIKKYRHTEVTTLNDFNVNKWFYSGISKNVVNKNLESIVMDGLKQISNEEIENIINRWIKDKSLLNNKQESIFTKEELNYIDTAPILKIGIEDWREVIYSDDGVKIDGLAGEITSKALEISGLKYKLVRDDWHVLLKDFENKKIDILPATYFTDQRATYGLYTNKYMTIKEFIYVDKKNNSIKSLNDLNHKKLAIVKGYGTIQKIKKKYPNINIIETKNLEDSIQKVLNGVVDAFFESQLGTKIKIRELSISSLNEIYQNDIRANDLHMFSKNDDKILQSILNKSLNAISKSEKTKIINNWLYTTEKKEVNIAFGKGREPYSIDKSYLKGIEYDLINKILNKSEISIKNVVNLSYDKLQNALQNDNSLDISVTVKEKEDGYYYSNNYIDFFNIIVTRVEDNITINTIDDLKDKRIIAFKDAYKYLGDKYFSLFNPKSASPTYIEYGFQEQQVKDFLDKKVDMIILDKNIFLWHLKRLTTDNLSKYKLNYIFPKKNSYKVAFKDENIRDLFNTNLKILKNNGDVEDIFSNYLDKDIEAKVKIDTLISTIVSRYIFLDKIVELNKIVNQLSHLDYIKKLEVFNNKNILLSSSSTKQLKKFISQGSHYIVSNMPTKVGYIKVYFDENILIEYSKNEAIIPNVDIFRELDSYSYIKKIYRRFGYLNKDIIFTKKEQLFIANNPVITFSESDWAPLSIVEGSEFEGILSDYMKILENKTTIHFNYVKTRKWVDVLTKFENNEIDFIPGVANTKSIQNIGLVSNSFVKFNFAIITNEKGSFVNGLKGLNGKTVALPKSFTSNIIIRTKYPKIKVIDTKTVKESLRLVSEGKVDASVGHEAISVYNIKKYFKNLKIVGLSKEEFTHHMLIKRTNPELLSIVNKVIASITQKQKEDIKERWIKTNVSTEVDYSLLYKIVGIFFMILMIVLYFIKKLSLAKKNIEITNEKLNENIVELKNTQEKLVESEKMASLGGLVAGVAHEINTPVGIGLTGITHFLDISKELKTKYESDNMTQDEFETFLNLSNELGVQINSNLQRTVKLVQSFKQVAVDQTSENKREFNLKKYIEEVLLSINSETKKTNLDIDVSCDETLVINSYPGALAQVIINLVLNSIHHAYDENDKGNILINVSRLDNTITLKFIDDGKGISKENLMKIFDPFFTTNRQHGGTGLGLNIIYNIVTTKLSGKIVCDSKETEGTTFLVTFSCQ